MKRDMELVRQILYKLEEVDADHDPDEIALDGYTREQIGYHAHIMAQAGLIKAADATAWGDAVPQAMPMSLTWSGHDFLDAARVESRWQKALEIAKKLGGSVTLQVMLNILTKLMQNEVDALMS